MTKLETIVGLNLAKTLKKPDEAATELDLDEDLMYGYGLTSLDMIMLMSNTCSDAGVPLTEFTEEDISRMRTPRDIVSLLSTKVAA